MTAGESAERKVKVAATAHLKFSAVLGTVSAKSSIFMRPALCPPIDTSKNTTGFPLASPGMEPTPDISDAVPAKGRGRRLAAARPRGRSSLGAARAHAGPSISCWLRSRVQYGLVVVRTRG